ncbi:MAG: DNA repair protein RadC [Bacteroidales bacterium]|nr:DNA repair protein RadC [Bacteroidales bacterium]
MEDTKKILGIKSWAEEDRPREKLLMKGKSALSDSELIAILIGSGNKNETAVDLAKKILKSVNNNLSELAKLSVRDLIKFEGIGEAKAISIIASLELGNRRKGAEAIIKDKITGSADVFNYFQPQLSDIKHEELRVLLLNKANKIIKQEKLSTGGIAGTIVDIKITIKAAVENLASGIILCHNHPSGNTKPSSEDINITKKLKEAAKLVDISLLDHIIICETGYYSFADEGML